VTAPAAPPAVLCGVLAAGGVAEAEAVAFTGADPVLPSAFRLATAGAAVLGAVGLAAGRLHRLRTGRTPRVAVDLREAALALRTDRHFTVDGHKARDIWSPLAGFYRTADERWIQFHTNFPHHRDGILRVLGVPGDRAQVERAEVERAVATWAAAALEDTLAAAGLCATMLRGRGEWAAHPQGRAVAGLPLLEIRRIADAPPEPLPPGDRPLAGIRVLDLTRVIAGPVAGRTLAEHGADVLRIASPRLPFVAPLVIETGHGKRAAFVDLDTAAGRERLGALVDGADVFLQAYRPGALAARGFGAEELARRRPGLVSVSLSAYGHEGPWAGRRGFDTLVQTASGLVEEHSRGRARPSHLPAQALDYATGYLAAYGTMLALARRAEEGGSWLVRVSLAQTAHWLDRLGRVPDPEAALALPDPTDDDVADLLVETASPFGRLRHLRPAPGLLDPPARRDRPPVPLGTDPPIWLDR